MFERFNSRIKKLRKKIGLKDIANKVGVSTTLVSYVLNNQFKNRISEETANRIREAAAELNYRPNQIAKSLRGNKTQTIGLIISDIANPFSSNIARIIEDEATKNKYNVLFGSADENIRKAEKIMDVLLSRQVDGFILAPPEDFEEQLVRLKKEGVPFVLIDRYFERIKAHSISINNFETSYNVTRHLLDNGYKNVGMINYKTRLHHLKERNRGYIEALETAGIEFNPDNLKEIEEESLDEAIVHALDALLEGDHPVDALFFSSSKVSIKGLAYLGEKKVRIPEELGVVCFDETEAYRLFPSKISYVKQPLESMGKEAVKTLLEEIDGVERDRNVVFNTELIIQESSLKKQEY